MLKIKCPSCGNEVVIDDNQEAVIMSMVRDSAFDASVEKRANELTDIKVSELEQKLKEQSLVNEKQVEDVKRNGEVSLLQVSAEYEKKLKEADVEISKLKAEASLDIAKAVSELEKIVASKEAEIERIKVVAESEKQLAINIARSEEKLLADQREAELTTLLKEQERQTEYYKDLKAKMSTKMIGETLEQHCLCEFNKLRATAFRGVYFEKDNDARSGSKGDFIYRECDPDGVEIISIMFEMKNEMDSTEQKHRNDQFFKELDKDRREKNCEYAVLVSMLEADSELYNTGIVDVSYEYEKMYVIRPQFFIPMITVLRNAAYNSLYYRQELERMRCQETDVGAFEEALTDFKERFGKNYDCAKSHLDTALSDIDKTISKLQKIRDDLVTTQRQFRLADDKLDALSVKKLAKNSVGLLDEINHTPKQELLQNKKEPWGKLDRLLEDDDFF